MKMTPSITIMDFSGVYEQEEFCHHPGFRWVDCRSIQGICGYCDHAAAMELRRKIADLPADGIHFIDSGNFHYLTGFWLEKLHEPFNLAVFDHHTDMQKPLFGDILSCGDWILEALKRIPNLRKVLLLGISGDQKATLTSRPYAERIFCYDAETIHQHHFVQDLWRIHENLPLYCSIDKDVLSPSVVQTDWEQGTMSAPELAGLLKQLLETHRILGIDVCGECANTIQCLHQIARDDAFNHLLLEFLKNHPQRTQGV